MTVVASVAVLSDIHYFLHARASDADALAVMAPRDGRGQAGPAT